MERILFVCTGNTCRSSMAEGLFRAAVENDEELAGKYAVASAGLSAFGGEPASMNAQLVLKGNWNVDISSHAARRLDEYDIKNAVLILTMTRAHKHSICSAFPEEAHKIFTLKEYAYNHQGATDNDEYDYSLDITDPYGKSLPYYKRCAEEIKDAVDKTIERLKRN